MNDDMLQGAIDSKTDPVFMASRAAVTDYYQDTYGTNWKSHAAAAIAGTTDKSSRAYKSASRQFQMDKRTGQERYKSERVTADTRARYESVGKTLPPVGRKLQGDSITITVTGTQKAGKGKGTRERTINVTLKGANAQDFINNPSYGDVWEEYGVDADLFDDGDYAIDVSSVA
jgi:hypothetical protein